MGLCFSSLTEDQRKEIQQSSKLEKDLDLSKNKEKKVLKILLLGTGESGKSTIFKQMQILYQGGFNEYIRSNFRNVVHKNVLESMQQLIKVAEKQFNLKFETKEEKQAAEFIMCVENISPDMTTRVASCIEKLWKESEAIKTAYEKRNQFYIIDSAE